MSLPPTVSRIPSFNNRRSTLPLKAASSLITQDENANSNSNNRRISMSLLKSSHSSNNGSSNNSIRKPLTQIDGHIAGSSSNIKHNNNLHHSIDKMLPPTKPTVNVSSNNNAQSYSQLKKSEQALNERVQELERLVSTLQDSNNELTTQLNDKQLQLNKQNDQYKIDIEQLNQQIEQLNINHNNSIQQLKTVHKSEIEDKEQQIESLKLQISNIHNKLHANKIDIVSMQPMTLSTSQQTDVEQYKVNLSQQLQLLSDKLNQIHQRSTQQAEQIKQWNSDNQAINAESQ